MHIERGLVLPQFEQRQLVRVQHTLEHLELLTAGLLHDFRATSPKCLRELRTLSRFGCDRYDEADCHVVSSDALPMSVTRRCPASSVKDIAASSRATDKGAT